MKYYVKPELLVLNLTANDICSTSDSIIEVYSQDIDPFVKDIDNW